MISPSFTKDAMVKRLRVITFGTIIFDMMNMLAGQPGSFWHTAQTAIRGDGLSINNPTNYVFMLFLGSGWLAYLITCLAYLCTVFLLVSLLPRKTALIIMFAFIFGHYFDTANWLAVRWHLGMQGPFYYGLAISVSVALLVLPPIEIGSAVMKLRWIMIFAMLVDAIVTLVGQPIGYLHNSQLVDEGNIASRFFLMQGWYVFLTEQAVICFAMYWLASKLPKTWGTIVVLCYTFAGFTGTSNWFFYRWKWGMESPVIFGAILGVAIVLLTFRDTQPKEISVTTADQIPMQINDDKKSWCVC